MEEKEYKQKDGDFLIILGKGTKKDYVVCISKKYQNKFEAKKCHIISGCVNNPEKDNFEFIGKSFLQKCGDTLLVVEKTKEKDKDGSYLFRCRFLKYPYEIFLSNKKRIKEGGIDNPQIEQVEFISKEWQQKCGDSLRILEKVEPRKWRCQFLKYPYEIICEKSKILEGSVVNPQIDKDTFCGQLYIQNCGDVLKVLKKTTQKDKNGNNFLYECEFQKYKRKVVANKRYILEGSVYNPSLPWCSKQSLENFIKQNFKSHKKITLKELADKLEISLCTIGRKINEFNLRSYITYYESYEEASLRNFVSQFVEVYPEEYSISDKEGKYYGIDVYIPSKKIGFEFNGTYWHSELFKDSQYHQRKSLAAAEQGIQLFHIWEYEWSDPIKRPIIESLIKSKLGIFSQKIGASKCKIVDLSYKKYSDFCNENHIQGEAGAKVKLGLVYEGKLVQVMSFGAPRFADTIEWEIIRECSKSDTIILGGKEKLWNFFLKKYNPKSVLSYCDYSKFNGSSYLKLGFKKSRLNKPGFVWYDEKNRNIHWRNPYKHKEYSKKFIKVWDCGQLVFLWQSSK